MSNEEPKELCIVIVGIGGVGTDLAYRLGRFCQFLDGYDTTILLIDGDAYEEKNAERQVFEVLGNKAEVTSEAASRKFDKVSFVPVDEYLTPDNIDFYLDEGNMVFCCVDNHKTRRLIDEHVSALSDAVLISGGNDLTDGNVQMYLRKEGLDLTASLSDVHKEIAEPADRSPHELSCEELAAASEPQLFFANGFVTSLMCMIFWNLVTDDSFASSPPYGELYFDLKTGRVLPIERPPSTTNLQ